MRKPLKLTELSKKEMAKVVGGRWSTPTCSCTCAYEDQGGSSTIQNMAANHRGGLSSPKGLDE